MPVSTEPESEQPETEQPETVTTDTEVPNPAGTDDESADQGEAFDLVGALAAA
ncbi:hypothetical protein IPZ61_30115 [Streptomyces sioyaensis]|uniref:hypothetical protein n=1 Tax=Streptomyces sioyaensis TaxID=67364 RepID=UPI001F2A9830|nr:hypothetical protein [Streptomyces sioyaensis]MCF3177554.1 hypothetical protein [Streptomyces sioyaensis]